MKAFSKCTFLVLVLIKAIAFSQTGYYPPPSSVFFHNDTLTISPPDSLPGEPTVLLGYNIYVDSSFFDNITLPDPEATLDFIFDDQDLLPGIHEFCAKALYNDWISETACDTGLVIYGVELPFLEDWSSGGFEENLWTYTSGNWIVENEIGNPAPMVTFQGEPGLVNYEAILESYPINATGNLIGRIWLDFDIKLDAAEISNYEQLFVQIWNNNNLVWTTIEEFSAWHAGFDWESKHINIKPYAMNRIFKIRFVATGANSEDIIAWQLDNIHIYRKCDGASDLEIEEHLEYNLLQWEGPDVGFWDDWINWDDGVNSGNSIGTGGAVEFDVAAHWISAQLVQFQGASIRKIAFFPAESAATYRVRIWEGSGPDTLVVDQLVVSPVIGQWNYITLSTPVPLDITRDLWVGYNVNTTTGYPSGVDDGPAIDGYGNMMYFEGEWQALLEINVELDYNWNIACYLVITYPIGTYLAYKLYRETNNSGFQFYSIIDDNIEFVDSNIVLSDFYCYKLTTFWVKNSDTCESVPTNTACEVLMLGTGSEQQESQIRIYPNPAQTMVNVTADEEIREVRVYSTLGEKILKLEIGNLEGVIDVSGLKNGIYFMEVVTENQVAIKKILIFR